jgi:hypothetical protein
VTVLFADVKGSMDLAEQVDPEGWHKIMDRFFAILSEGVHRFEGTINQYTGDGIMALFRAPIAHEDHAQRACYAALHLGEELRRYAQELKRERGLGFSVQMGLNSGEVVVGKIGDNLRIDYTPCERPGGRAHRERERRTRAIARCAVRRPSRIAMALAVEHDEAADPGDVRLLGARAAVTQAERLAGEESAEVWFTSAAVGRSRFVECFGVVRHPAILVAAAGPRNAELSRETR